LNRRLGASSAALRPLAMLRQLSPDGCGGGAFVAPTQPREPWPAPQAPTPPCDPVSIIPCAPVADEERGGGGGDVSGATPGGSSGSLHSPPARLTKMARISLDGFVPARSAMRSNTDHSCGRSTTRHMSHAVLETSAEAARAAVAAAFAELGPEFSSRLAQRSSQLICLNRGFAGRGSAGAPAACGGDAPAWGQRRQQRATSVPEGGNVDPASGGRSSARRATKPAHSVRSLEENVAQACFAFSRRGGRSPRQAVGGGSPIHERDIEEEVLTKVLTEVNPPRLPSFGMVKEEEDGEGEEDETRDEGDMASPQRSDGDERRAKRTWTLTKPGSADSLCAVSSAASERGPRSEESKFQAMRFRTIGQVMQARVQDLANEVSFGGSEDGSAMSSNGEESTRDVPLALMMVGVLPWPVLRWKCLIRCYQLAVRLVVIAAAVASWWVTLSGVDEPTKILSGRHGAALSTLPLPLGAACGLVFIGAKRHAARLEQAFEMLARLSRDRGFRDWRSEGMRVPATIFFFLWILSVGITGSHSAFILQQRLLPEAFVQTASFAVCSGALLCLTFGMVCVCRSLGAMIDGFCCDAVDNMLVSDVAHVWNLTQAVLRHASNTIELCLFALCIVVAFVLPLTLVDVVGTPSEAMIGAVPPFLVALAVAYMISTAATVSEKCIRVPALINAVDFGPGTDIERHHVVNYIVRSGAGFHIFGVCLSMGIVLKFAYAWCVIAVGLVTRVAA